MAGQPSYLTCSPSLQTSEVGVNLLQCHANIVLLPVAACCAATAACSPGPAKAQGLLLLGCLLASLLFALFFFFFSLLFFSLVIICEALHCVHRDTMYDSTRGHSVGCQSSNKRLVVS